MKKKSDFAIFNNAVDSLEHGIRMYQDDKYPNAHKYAILAVYQAIELFLKDALYRINPTLLYTNVDRPIREDSHTVTYKEAISRLKKNCLPVGTTEQHKIEQLQKRRNRIEHREYIPSTDDRALMADALMALYDFVPQYLQDNDLADYIDDDLWQEMQEFVLDYKKLLEQAKIEVEQLTNVPPGDFMPDIAECPLCENTMLVINGKERGDYCYFCRRVVPMQQCTICTQYFSEALFEESSRCPDCFMAQFDER